MENVNKIFYDDVREKKIAGYSASKRASRKRGIKGKVKFQHDNLTEAKWKKLNGKVEEYYMINGKKIEYDNINLTYEEFKELGSQNRLRQREVLAEWLKRHKASEVAKALGTSTGSIRSFRGRLGLKGNGIYECFEYSYPEVKEADGWEVKSKRPYNRKTNTDKKTFTPNNTQITTTNTQSTPDANTNILSLIKLVAEQNQKIEELTKQLESPKEEVVIEHQGFNLNLAGDLLGSIIQNRFEKFLLVLDESTKYRVNISIEELEELKEVVSYEES